MDEFDDDHCPDCGLTDYECRCHDGDDCGRMPDGTCMLAGTEFCDWECPYGT